MSHFAAAETSLPEHPFWQFSCQLYQERSVKQACLGLQNQLGMNVNVVLFACWLAVSGRGRLQAADFTRIKRVIGHWHQSITAKLRHFRQQMSQQVAANDDFNLVNAVQQDELVAEHIEQLLLAQGMSRTVMHERTGLQKVNDAIGSLQTYAKYLDVILRPAERQWCADILQAVFNRMPEAQVKQMCGVVD